MVENKIWGLIKKQHSALIVFDRRSFIFLIVKIQYSKYIYELILRQLERKGESLDLKNHS